MPEQSQNDLSFNQYGVLARQILDQQRQIEALQTQINRTLNDHENRIRRNEVMLIVGFFTVVIIAMLLYFLTRP